MGYNTSYRLECIDTAIVAAWIESGESEEADYALTDDGSTNESCKWYEHEQDLLALSAKHPDVLFTLHGEGEEAGDVWRKYFLGGKVHAPKTRIVIPEFDPKELR